MKQSLSIAMALLFLMNIPTAFSSSTAWELIDIDYNPGPLDCNRNGYTLDWVVERDGVVAGMDKTAKIEGDDHRGGVGFWLRPKYLFETGKIYTEIHVTSLAGYTTTVRISAWEVFENGGAAVNRAQALVASGQRQASAVLHITPNANYPIQRYYIRMDDGGMCGDKLATYTFQRLSASQ